MVFVVKQILKEICKIPDNQHRNSCHIQVLVHARFCPLDKGLVIFGNVHLESKLSKKAKGTPYDFYHFGVKLQVGLKLKKTTTGGLNMKTL